MKRSRILFIVLISLMLLSALLLTSCAEEVENVTGITSVEIEDGTVTVKATLEESYANAHSSDTLYILALDKMTPSGSLSGAKVVAESKAARSMTFTFSLWDEVGASRVASAFVLAEKNGDKYSALTDFAYVTNPDSVAKKSEGHAATAGIKGVSGNDPLGASVIGAEHIVIEADMLKLILNDFDPEATRFNYGGVTYFYNGEAVESLDKLISDAKSAGMRIYIRTVLSNPDEGAFHLQLLPDLTSESNVRMVKAFYAFLATRYSVSDYIIGDRVNSYSEFCYADKLETEELERMYSYWARISNNTLKSINSSAKIYVPVDNSWKSEGQGGVIGAQAFLSHFASNAKAGGDYDYAVALNLGDGDDLTALLNDEGYNYSKIGAINLSEFSDFIDRSEMRYKSEKRDMIIDGLAMRKGTDSQNSAAYYAFAYYTAAENGFDAFIYSGKLCGDGYSRSDLYYAFMMCGSSMNSQLSDYTSKFKGVHIPAFDDHVSNNLNYVQRASSKIDEQSAKNKKSFPASLSSFKLIGDVKNFQGTLNENGSSWLLELNASGAASGVMATGVSAESIVGSKYVGITLKSEAARTVYLMIRNEKDGAEQYTLVGECQVEKGQRTYYFDISEFAKGVDESDTFTVAICMIPDADEETSVEVVGMALYGNSTTDTETIIIIIVVVVIVLALVGLIVLLAVKRKKKAAAAHDD